VCRGLRAATVISSTRIVKDLRVNFPEPDFADGNAPRSHSAKVTPAPLPIRWGQSSSVSGHRDPRKVPLR